MPERTVRAVRLYFLPLASIGMIAWLLTTDPPAEVVVLVVILLGWPLLGIARIQGSLDAIREAREHLDATMRDERP